MKRFLLLLIATTTMPAGAGGQASGADSTLAGARDPAWSPDGRLAVSIDGDLFVQRAAGSARFVRLTSGAAWDRHPAWTRDGSAIIYSSNEAGQFDLWRVAAPPAGTGGAPDGATAGRDAAPASQPTRLTSDAADDVEPATTPNGDIVFVRGRGALARLWVRTADGGESRLTTGGAEERAPAVSPDGDRVAYVAMSGGGPRLRLRHRVEGAQVAADSVVLADQAVESPAWSPDGARLVFTAGGSRPGVFVTSTSGAYVNLVASRHAQPAWSPDGTTIMLADIIGGPQGYNGDPERTGDRSIAAVLDGDGGLSSVAAPVAPDAGAAARPVVADRPRGERNREVFDRTWLRVRDAYFAEPATRAAGVRPTSNAARAAWDRARVTHRARTAAAGTDSALALAIHELLADRPPLRQAATGRAAVSSAHPVASAAGAEILRRGGNVVDAAVAVSFALGVAEPDASGVGGYGQMLVLLKGMDDPALIEFMTRVPEEASLDNASLNPGGEYPDDGPVLANVPGTVAGMYEAWKRFGSRSVPWGDLLAPAIRAARQGVPVSDGFATTLRRERAAFLKYEGSRALFFPDGEPLAAGDTLRNPDLAWVLERIAADSADGFYRGEVARRLVQDLRGKGNAIRLTDLARYFAAEREPVSTTFRDFRIYSSAPPVSGGASLAAKLNLLEQTPRPGTPYSESAPALHAMIAAWQLVPSSRGRIGDPSLWPVDITPFVSKDTARARWQCFDASKALTPDVFEDNALHCARPIPAGAPAGTGPTRRTGDATGHGTGDVREGSSGAIVADGSVPSAWRPCDVGEHAEGVRVCRSHGTTAFVVGDADGNVVAVTQTLGTWGGNFYVTPGLGFLYNDKLTSYGSDPDSYGARLPYARHGSTIAPTIVTRGEGADRHTVLAVGAAGNAWITSAVFQTLVGVLDDGLSAQEALELPRFLPGSRGSGPDRAFEISIESGVNPDVLRALERMGYHFDVISLPGELRMGYGAAITFGNGSVTAGADPRRSGAAEAVP